MWNIPWFLHLLYVDPYVLKSSCVHFASLERGVFSLCSPSAGSTESAEAAFGGWSHAKQTQLARGAAQGGCLHPRTIHPPSRLHVRPSWGRSGSGREAPRTKGGVKADRWTAWRLGAQAKEALERIKIISSPLKPRREDLTYMLLVGGERCTPRTQGLGRVVVVVARRGLSPDFLLQKHNNHPPQKKNTPR